MPTSSSPQLGQPAAVVPASDPQALVPLLQRLREPLWLCLRTSDHARGLLAGDRLDPIPGWEPFGRLPPIYPEWLGDRAFTAAHGLRFPYVAGEMARGISSPEMVIAMARAGMLGFLGSAGLGLARTERAIETIEAALAGTDAAWGANLIHSPGEPELEEATVRLFLQRKVKRVSASAFMKITRPVVEYACHGLRRGTDGQVLRHNFLFAKISRPEVARQFASPPPQSLLDELLRLGRLSAEEVALARTVPVAPELTVEADSGGHTDNRPLTALFPTIAALCRDLAREHGYPQPLRVGAAGGLGTPEAVAAAFALGAAYVLVGSVNQTACESGLAERARALLADAGVADMTMAPSADMFELGARVQVLRRGTLFAQRANRLDQLYRDHDSLEALPAAVREQLERDLFRAPLTEIWASTEAFFASRDPQRLERAYRKPKERMALIFRWYLGRSSQWAVSGDPERVSDYQIWSGPAVGAFNAWVADSFLADLANRSVEQIARNLLEGAAVITRMQQARTFGLALPATAFDFRPRPLS